MAHPPPRMSGPPQKQGAPILMIVVLVAITVTAGLLTWALYPTEQAPPPAPPPPAPRPPMQKLVELPVQEPILPPTEDAGADADGEEETVAKKRTGRGKRRIPEGTIDKRRVSAFIRAKRGQVQQCYERRLKANNMLQGVLVPEIRIHPSGSVMAVNFSQDTLHDTAVRECVARVIQSWQFPQPDGGAVTVSNPFRFSPKVD